MTAQKNKERIQSMYKALEQGRPEAFLEALADDVRWTIIGSTKFSRTYAGKAELTEKLLEPFMAELDGHLAVEPANFVAEGAHVVMQSQGRSRTRYGKDYNNTYCHVFRLADDQVVEVTEYLDTELVTEAFRP